MDSDEPRIDGEPEDPWEGPPQKSPEEESGKETKRTELAPGLNELRVVKKIEDYMNNSRGPRIQVIKSRDIKNAEHFSEKVFRVLEMRGYKIEKLSSQDLKSTPSKESSSSNTIYAINETVIKEFLGSDISQSGHPIRYIFDNSMLSYLKKPVVISTVSDGFYNSVGMQSIANSPGEGRTTRQKVTREVGVNRLASSSLYLAAIAFALSGVNNLFGSLVNISYFNNTITPLPAAILFLSVAAIFMRGFSLRKEDGKSIAMVAFSIIIFVAFVILLFVNPYFQNYYLTQILNTQPFPTNTSSNLLYSLLSLVVIVVSLSRYPLFLGRNSGKSSYLLAIGGITLLLAVVLMVNMPFITIFGNTVNSLQLPLSYLGSNLSVGFNYIYSPNLPLFGNLGYFEIFGTPQYILFRNFLLLLANVMLSVSFIVGAKHLKGRYQN